MTTREQEKRLDSVDERACPLRTDDELGGMSIVARGGRRRRHALWCVGDGIGLPEVGGYPQCPPMVDHGFGDAALRDERPADLSERSSQALFPSRRLEDVDRLFDQAERVVDLAGTKRSIGDVLDDPSQKLRVARAFGMPA